MVQMAEVDCIILTIEGLQLSAKVKSMEPSPTKEMYLHFTVSQCREEI